MNEKKRGLKKDCLKKINSDVIRLKLDKIKYSKLN